MGNLATTSKKTADRSVKMAEVIEKCDSLCRKYLLVPESKMFAMMTITKLEEGEIWEPTMLLTKEIEDIVKAMLKLRGNKQKVPVRRA